MSDIFDLFRSIETQKQSSAPITAIVAGLGNIGKEYDRTRHNAGFRAIDIVAQKYGAVINRAKFDALCAEVTIGTSRVLLMKPQLLMNRSGISIGKAANFYHVSPEHILVLVDDINFDVGTIRIRRSGSSGGHNGLKDIIAHLGTDAFPRIKIGVGKLPLGGDLVSWVLGRIPTELMPISDETDLRVADAVSLILQGEFEKAMGTFNTHESHS